MPIEGFPVALFITLEAFGPANNLSDVEVRTYVPQGIKHPDNLIALDLCTSL